MALQAGVQTSKVLILMGAGLTGSIILRSGRLSELISQLQELLKGVDEVEFSPYKYDHTLLAAQIKQLAQELKDLTASNPVTILNGNSDSGVRTGGIASYLVPAAALGALGYCYMWWKGLSFSDVMFVTKQNMADAVTVVSKQLDNVSQTLNSTKRHLTKRLESLDWKLEEQKETSQLITNNVDEMKSNLSQIGSNVEMIHQMVAGLEGKIELLESKQDVANSGLWYLCQFAEGVKDGVNAKLFQDVGAKLAIDSAVKFEEKSVKGLQFLAETNESAVSEKPTVNSEENDVESPVKKVPTMKTKIHRSYPVGISWARDICHRD
ncbi:uncharacterized protein LOC110408911 isoform X1 [Herrania umbratica]|uniref:Uncharacterized protein LOC110408911 isoform X1 n=1 Tax=Herrania umbratica TaxID=108875 RepID=A0A6J0ZHT5_9ROSI|nr:uncharacterized protein LOC110408911 isoform X1 [Herrania umbratica]